MVPKTCSVDGCENIHRGLGYCLMHYKRFRRYGDPNIKRPTKPAHERFWAKVDKSGNCWVWTGGLTKQGYGGFHPIHGETVLAHRFAYEAHNGPIPDGMVIDHKCHNGTGCPPGPCPHRRCVNPDHLEPVSSAENSNRSHNGNAQKTHCPRGHEYTPSNTRLLTKRAVTSRICRTCQKERDAQRIRGERKVA